MTKANTYERIIDVSLQLFNEHGERAITTNHIAHHLNMSPGNLYYHFANKDEIIIQLFKRYSAELFSFLSQARLPESVDECIQYMNGIYDIMWEYRFLFSDINSLLFRSATLLGEHNTFTRERIAPLLVKLLGKMQEKNIIQIDEIGVRDLSVNMWLITKYWFDFDSSLSDLTCTPKQAKARGIYRTLSLLRPYFQPEHRALYDEKVRNMNL